MKRPTQREENALTLAAALGLDVDCAGELLDQSIQVTHEKGAAWAALLAMHAVALLRRTFKAVGTTETPIEAAAVEVRVGRCAPHSKAARTTWINVRDGRILIANEVVYSNGNEELHELYLLISACYAAARTVQQVVGAGLPFGNDQAIVVDPVVLGAGADLRRTIELGTAILAGAGAVGNAFIFALKLVPVHGVLYVVDPKRVNDGILNRCMCFETKDVDQFKATALCARAQPNFPDLKLIPRDVDLATAAKELGDPARIERLIVGVDSRRTRRSLQKELPREVFDASTTGIAEIVLHFNSQPFENACLGCIYKRESGEIAHETHVAELLGVSVADVRSGYISEAAAWLICQKYLQLEPVTILGMAYDSLFKALCGQGELKTPEDRQVLAPFAFVSVLAGALLVLELAIRLSSTPRTRFNYWRVSPWHAPVPDLRQIRPALPDCEICKNAAIVKAARSIWR